MMSRLALYPVLGAGILWLGRERVGPGHLVFGAALGLVPLLAMLHAAHPVTGLPFLIRWASFGMMIAGFSGTTAKWGFRRHLDGLGAAAALVSLTIIFLGADFFSGNPNRTGMLLALGFIASLSSANRRLGLLTSALILPGLVVSSFMISWIAAGLGGLLLLAHRRFRVNPGVLISIMILAQVLFCVLPGHGAGIGPTLEMRTLIWKTGAGQLVRSFPLGAGTGQSRMSLHSEGGHRLQTLAGPGRRVDYLHSEPLTIVTEFGLAGAALLALFLVTVFRSAGSRLSAALLPAFWVIFASDLPVATPLGALPAALILAGCLGGARRVSLPAAVPGALLLASIPWMYMVIAGYSAMNRSHNPVSASRACRLIPFEERAFLGAGWAWLRGGSPLEAFQYSQRFVELYPFYYGGWELHAGVLGALHRFPESASASRRAFALAPDGHHDRNLFALNGVPHSENSGDTLLLLGCAFSADIRWSRQYPRIGRDAYPGISSRYLILAENLSPLDRRLAGRIFSKAVFIASHGPEPERSRALAEAAAVYGRYSDTVPPDEEARVILILQQREGRSTTSEP